MEAVLRTGKMLTLHPSQGHANGLHGCNGNHEQNRPLTGGVVPIATKMVATGTRVCGAHKRDIEMDNQDLGIEERLRRNARPPRSQSFSTRVTKKEEEELIQAAKSRGLTAREWSREVLLREARTSIAQTAMLTEMTALRLLLNKVLRPVALGESISAEEYAQILTEVRTTKHAASLEVLSQYTSAVQKEH